MKRIDIKTTGDLMAAAKMIIEASAKEPGTEIWHPSLVWAAPTLLAEWDEVTSHAPRALAIRITTPFKVTVVRDFWNEPEMRVPYDTAYNIRLELLVSRALKNLIGRNPAVVDINVDWESIIPIEVHSEKVRRRRRR